MNSYSKLFYAKTAMTHHLHQCWQLEFDVDIIFTWQEGYVLPDFILLRILAYVNICVSYAQEHTQITAEITTCTVFH